MRKALGVQALAAAIIALGLVFSPQVFDVWPWPLPALPATIVGAWFCTVAASLLWFALRERDWSRARIGVAPIAAALALDLVAALRLRHGFAGDTATGRAGSSPEGTGRQRAF
jgi:hypothetical protein